MAGDTDWSGLDPKQTTTAAIALIDEHFGGDTPPAPLDQHALTEAQARALRSLASVPGASFRNVGRLWTRLQQAGLPKTGPDLMRFVGATEPGPADRLVDDKAIWLWCRLTLMGELPQEDWLSRLKTLDADELAAVVADLATAPYGLFHRWPQPTNPSPNQQKEDEAALQELLGASAAIANIEYLGQFGDFQLSRSPRNDRGGVMVCDALLRATGELPQRFDPLVVGGLNLYVPACRSILKRLPTDRAEAIVLKARFHPRQPRGAWAVVDVVPTEPVARRVVEEVSGWGDRDDVPLERALEVLRGMGDVGVAAIDQALSSLEHDHPKRVALLEARG